MHNNRILGKQQHHVQTLDNTDVCHCNVVVACRDSQVCVQVILGVLRVLHLEQYLFQTKKCYKASKVYWFHLTVLLSRMESKTNKASKACTANKSNTDNACGSTKQ